MHYVEIGLTTPLLTQLLLHLSPLQSKSYIMVNQHKFMEPSKKVNIHVILVNAYWW